VTFLPSKMDSQRATNSELWSHQFRFGIRPSSPPCGRQSWLHSEWVTLHLFCMESLQPLLTMWGTLHHVQDSGWTSMIKSSITFRTRHSTNLTCCPWKFVNRNSLLQHAHACAHTHRTSMVQSPTSGVNPVCPTLRLDIKERTQISCPCWTDRRLRLLYRKGIQKMS
jgi:hypothetical protein